MQLEIRKFESAWCRATVSCAVLALCFWIAPFESEILRAQVFNVRQYTESDGLPSSEVRGVVQAADGQMWFSTRNGIARYDGKSWKIFGANDGLPDSNQHFLALDHRERVWSVSHGPIVKVAVFDNGFWRAFPDRLNTRTALCLLTLETDSLAALIGHTGGLTLFQDGVPDAIHFEGNEQPQVFSLERFDDKIFAATSRGLFSVDLSREPKVQRVEGTPSIPMRGLAHDAARDQLWTVGRDWIGVYDGRKLTRMEAKYDDSGSGKLGFVAPARIGPNGDLFFGSPTGLFCYRVGEGIMRIGSANGLIGEGAYDLFMDREGLLWIVGARGISKIVTFAFANYGRNEGLLADEVSAILHRSDGTTVLGHHGGLTIMDGKPSRKVRLGSSLQTRVLDLAEDTAGNTWAAGMESGLYCIDPKGKQTQHFPLQPGWDYVSSVLVDPQGEIWITTRAGVLRQEGDSFVPHFPDPNMLVDNSLRRLFLDPQGAIHVATIAGGMWKKLGTSQWRNWTGGNGSALRSVYAFLDRGDGKPLIGTLDGLCALEGEKIVKLAKPRIDRPVYFIVEDHQDRLWMGTDNGVFRWDGTNMEQYTVEHGLVGRETNRAAGSIDAQGRLWIGTTKGLSVYYPRLDAHPSPPPEVQIIRISSGEHSQDAGDEFDVPHQLNAVTIDYRVVSFVDEREIQIRTWLEGLEPDWQSAKRTFDWKIQYNFLPPGNYRLHIQAANANGRWSDIVTSNSIRIRPPFWNTRWFYSLVLVFVGSIGYFSHRLVNQRRYLKRLERDFVARLNELQQSESRFGVTLASIADGVITTGLNGQILYVNPAAKQLMGRSTSDPQPRWLNELLPALGCSNQDRRELLLNIMAGTTWNSTLKFEKSSRTQLVEAGTAPLRNAEQDLLGAVVVLRDVTEKVRLQNEVDQSQRLASLGTLAGGIAHDFNNLLAVVKWNLSSLPHQPEATAGQGAIELIDDAVTQATSLTEQILTFAKGGSPQMQTSHLNSVVLNSISLATNNAEIRFDVDLADDLWPADFDTVQINQVLNNIFNNAIQAMPSGGLIRVRAINRFDPITTANRVVEIEVQDEGVGIPADQIQRVFEPYYSTKPTGYGIGLATCYSIVQKHHGRLTVESEVGQGSTVRIQLPASSKFPQVLTAEPETRLESNSAKRILVIDDDALIRKSLTAILQTVDFEVVSAEDGPEAIEIYRQQYLGRRRFHAVLIDLTMPGGIDGCETLNRLREIDPDVRGIVISGYSDDQVLSNYREHGFVDRLQKPCSLDELLEKLNKLPGENLDSQLDETASTSIHGSAEAAR